MNPSLAKALLADRQPGVQLLYGVATALNTVKIAGSTVAVELPALEPVVSGDYVAVLAAGADRLILGRVGDTGWHGVTFQNGWVNAGTYGAVQYSRVGPEVSIRGRMTGGTLSAACFTLPAGWRPANQYQIPVLGPSASSAALDVKANGECVIFASSATVDMMLKFSVVP